ncbi:MAG: hypothetical protein R3255_09280, partial [Candidatus Lokiarchaeia archaeon]|nr:hypothetical protein [Candidatus Lokiarchaeia archaeon]
KRANFPLFEINTENLNVNSVAKIIVDIVLGNKDGNQYEIGKIDWLEKLFQENRLEKFFD